MYVPFTFVWALFLTRYYTEAHQIRVHLQYLGFPIANDSVYSSEKIWVSTHVFLVCFRSRIIVLRKQGKKLGKGGIDLVPSDERSAPLPPPEFEDSTAEGRYRLSEDQKTASEQRKKKAQTRAGNPAWRTKEESTELTVDHDGKPPELLPRETGHDIGMGSPVPLSLEAVGIITRLRNQKVGLHILSVHNYEYSKVARMKMKIGADGEM